MAQSRLVPLTEAKVIPEPPSGLLVRNYTSDGELGHVRGSALPGGKLSGRSIHVLATKSLLSHSYSSLQSLLSFTYRPCRSLNEPLHLDPTAHPLAFQRFLFFAIMVTSRQNGRGQEQSRSYVSSFVRWLQLKKYQYEVTFSLYMLTSTEKIIFSMFRFTIYTR